MGKIHWGERGAREQLEQLTKDAPEITLNVAETIQGNTASYELQVYGKDCITTIEFDRMPKDTTPDRAAEEYTPEFSWLRRIGTILDVPVEAYRQGEKILSALGTGEFTAVDGKHLSSKHKWTLVRAVMECAEAAGIGRIKQIGKITRLTSLKEAVDYASAEPQRKVEELVHGYQ